MSKKQLALHEKQKIKEHIENKKMSIFLKLFNFYINIK